MEALISTAVVEGRMADVVRAEVDNFREYGDCRGPEHLEAHPEDRGRAAIGSGWPHGACRGLGMPVWFEPAKGSFKTTLLLVVPLHS